MCSLQIGVRHIVGKHLDLLCIHTAAQYCHDLAPVNEIKIMSFGHRYVHDRI